MELIDRLRAADRDSVQRINGSRIFGDAADEINRLHALNDETLDLLATIFDAYEEGPDCYEDPDEQAGYVGKAVKLDDAAFHRIADVLNEHRPRNSVVTANADASESAAIKGTFLATKWRRTCCSLTPEITRRRRRSLLIDWLGMRLLRRKEMR